MGSLVFKMNETVDQITKSTSFSFDGYGPNSRRAEIEGPHVESEVNGMSGLTHLNRSIKDVARIIKSKRMDIVRTAWRGCSVNSRFRNCLWMQVSSF